MLRALVLASILLSSSFAQVATPTGLATLRTPTLAAPALRVLVPAYFYPVANSPWTRLSAVAALHPKRIAAIGNVFNGPGTSFDASYAVAFADFRAHGGTLLGYVYTSYGARPLAQVFADIDQWLAWYPLDGFFLDEMANTPGQFESYYQAIYQYARSKVAGALVVDNPGTSTSPSYLHWNNQTVASAVCIYEGSGGFSTWHSDAWVKVRPRQEFYALPYATPSAGWQAAVDHAFAENCGWVYVTDDVLPNPWDTLPAYFEALAAYVATF
ncbi:MAG: spherulation-specific family 4 protein [Planctomycetes bacterium]|nr:spherulation-specific family 4 protein [Planctomycetota bacterium]